jgi:protein-S-isoprenylcysteine O-methyltransferase Ste14
VADLPVARMLLFLQFPCAGKGGISAAAFNGILFAGFATIHSVLARDLPKRAIARLVGPARARAAYVTASGLTLSSLLYLWQPLSGTVWHATGATYWILSLLFLAALAGLFYAASAIDYPEFLGIRTLLRTVRGQPAKPPAFSVNGPYAYCRHPMYSFLLMTLWVGPVMTYGRLEFAALASLYLLAGTVLEERNLRRELGSVYDDYAASVPMWIPRTSRWTPADFASQMPCPSGQAGYVAGATSTKPGEDS